MARYELHCADCGVPATASRKDAKYCTSCVVLRQVGYSRAKFKRPKTCRLCGAKFRPAKGRDIACCGKCEAQRHTHPTLKGKCRYCDRTVADPAPLEQVCWPCMKDPATQERIFTALVNGQNARRQAHGDTLAARPPIRRL